MLGKACDRPCGAGDTPVAVEASLLLVSASLWTLSVEMQVLHVLTFACCDIAIAVFRCWSVQ